MPTHPTSYAQPPPTMLESSGDLRAVQELLGHAGSPPPRSDTHLDFQHLAKVYDSAHLRGRKRDRKRRRMSDVVRDLQG